MDDVYDIAKMIKEYDDIEIVREKDYIKNPKENGYRSYHLVIKVPLKISGDIHKVYLEIQIRTIAMDFWSSLEHQMKYKKNIKNQQIIVEELKKCAEQIATTDINMLAIRNMINRKKEFIKITEKRYKEQNKLLNNMINKINKNKDKYNGQKLLKKLKEYYL